MAAGGLLTGAWWVKNQHDQAKKSRAEKDDPDGGLEDRHIVRAVPAEMVVQCASSDFATHMGRGARPIGARVAA